jgi:type I restriction enzyme S subunit
MIDGLRPYAEMHETGLPWLGDVPAHWDVRRNGRLFGARRETGFPDLPVLEVSIRSGVRIRNFDNGGRKQEMTDRSKYQRAVRGDIAYNMMRMWQGAVGIAPADGLVSPAYVVARPFPEADAAYYAYLFRTAAYMREIDVFSRGIVPDRNRLYWESFKQMPSVYPPLDEQRLIVRFLDWHGVQTAKLVRAKTKIIALLNEQKQAIIHRAVTRGLDPNAKLKPSGIPWVGDVPEGWEIRKLASLFRLVGSGTTPSGSSYYDGGIPWVMSGDLNNEVVNSTKRTVTDAAIKEISALRVYPEHSLIVAMYGATIGKTGVLAMEACTNQACCVLASPKSIVNVEYVQMFINIAKSHLVEQGYGGGQPNINAEIVKGLRVPIPPLAQQESIVFAVRSGGENKAIQNANREITLIQEFRTRLIADVVTGKLDVRAAAASLPETVELEPIDDLVEGDDLDEAVDDAENEEVAA